MTTRILAAFPLAESALEKLSGTGTFDVTVKADIEGKDLATAISGVDILIVPDTTTIDRSIIEGADALKVIAVAGIDTENMDLDYITSRGILVMNTPKARTITAAEHTISMLMALCRNIPQATASMKEGKWEKKKFMGAEVYNKTLGILGLGNIGRDVATLAMRMGMRVIAQDPYVSENVAARIGVKLVDLDHLLKNSDFITIHTPLTDRTRSRIDVKAFKKMKEGVRIINCAGGGIVSENHLVWAIEKGIVAGAALDVFEDEPATNKEILENEKIILTPHLAGFTEEAHEKVSMTVANQIIDYITGGTVTSPVNFLAISPDTLEVIQPYLELGEKIGSFAGQIIDAETKISQIEISYLGAMMELPVSPITPYILKSFLSHLTDRTVNSVNAPVIAEESNIYVRERTSRDTEDYSSELVLTLTGDDISMTVMGAIIGSRPRIVKVDDYFVEAIPEGYMLLVSNEDLPGVVGSVGSALGEAGVNIGRMQLARDNEKKQNLILINLDSPIDDAAIKKLEAITNVLDVRMLKF